MKRMIAFLSFLVCTISLFAQTTRTIKGKVTDDAGSPLQGVSVLIRGTKTGTQTDASGNFIQIINGGTATATYSDNYDLAGNNNNSIKTFLKNTLSTFNFSIGAEWLFKKPNIYEDEPITNTNYDWKIGVSILDIGKSKFNPAQGSFEASVPKSLPVSEVDIER
ncbi:hypothetical protein E3E36_11150, partial [Thermococcus sp. M36]|uniref:carboxypeptidase-like regulatory domain-containing protein n=1 Tax=Thermococcus sp. M36 TaxID=1638261 RepID=UPI00143BA804